MKEVNLIATSTWEDKWNELDDVAKAEHKLSNSRLYQYYTRGKQLAERVSEINQNVDEEFQVRLPRMYYIDEKDQD